MSRTVGTGERHRRRWPRWLLAALLVLPVLEVVVLVAVGRWIGVLPTMLVLLVGTLVGAALLVREAPRSWRSLRESLGVGGPVVVDGSTVVPSRSRPAGVPQVGRQIVDGSLVLVGAVLILLPGLITDLVGIACLLPVTRALPRRLLLDLVERRAARFTGVRSTSVPSGDGPSGPDGTGRPGPAGTRQVLQGEVVEPAHGPDPGRLRKR